MFGASPLSPSPETANDTLLRTYTSRRNHAWLKSSLFLDVPSANTTKKVEALI